MIQPGCLSFQPSAQRQRVEFPLTFQELLLQSILPEQPIFYPVTNEEYAKEIAIRWNIKDSKIGYATRFEVKKDFMGRYEIQKAGGKNHTGWWTSAEDLEELNDNIVGLIEIIGEYK